MKLATIAALLLATSASAAFAQTTPEPSLVDNQGAAAQHQSTTALHTRHTVVRHRQTTHSGGAPHRFQAHTIEHHTLATPTGQTTTTTETSQSVPNPQ